MVKKCATKDVPCRIITSCGGVFGGIPPIPYEYAYSSGTGLSMLFYYTSAGNHFQLLSRRQLRRKIEKHLLRV